MKKLMVVTLFFVSVWSNTDLVIAHSGRTDSRGGHNCNVGSCAGTYHHHNGGSSPTPNNTTTPTSPKPVAPTPPDQSSQTSTQQNNVSSEQTSTSNSTAPVLSTTTELITQEEPIPFTTSTVEDASKQQGESGVQQQGKDGVLSITFEVTYSNGEEQKREKISEEVTLQPTPEIRFIGTLQELATTPIENNPSDEQAEATAGEAVAGLAIMGGLGYGAYKGVQRVRSRVR